MTRDNGSFLISDSIFADLRRATTSTIAFDEGERTGRRELEVNLRRESRELGFHENRPPNYPPREVFLVLKLKFYTKIFAL